MNGVGSAQYGILTNGHDFRLYEYVSEENQISSIDGFDVEAIATTEFENLSSEQRDALSELKRLHHNRYVDYDDVEYFRETYREVPVQYQPGTDDEGYELFLEAVKDSLDELSEILKDFFEDYRSREDDSYPKQFLDSTFPDWKEWREYTGKSENAKEAFCRETAYIILNRAMFARIAEDKEIVGHTRLSSRGMADELELDDERPYLEALMDTYDRIDDHYPDLYELGIFDWWWVSKDKRGQFSKAERRSQGSLEDDLDYALRTVLKRLNRFNFSYVNRDILGHVYEDYLPKQERKELGEYYTPIEVVQFMLDSVDYRSSEGIGQKKILDPACGSGTFLTEVTERLIQHFLRKFNKNSVHELKADEAQTILERIEDNVYGIDINPFAAHITQLNLVFRTIDLYDKITEKDPYYTMDGFEIHVADTLSPTLRERKSGGTNTNTMQSGLEQFAEYNGRAQAFIEDRNAVDRIKDDEEFDIVVANPPYVRIQNLSTAKETYSEHYDSAIKNFDIYVPFIERGADWLTEDGKLTYICPNRLLSADYAEEIREQLVDEPLNRLIDFKDADVFDVPTPYPCIISVDREEMVKENQIQCARFAEKSDGVLDDIVHSKKWNTPRDEDTYDLFKYSQKQLEEDNQGTPQTWKPMPSDERRVFNKIQSNSDVRVSEVTKDVFVGTQTSADKTFIGSIVDEAAEEGVVKFLPGNRKEPVPIEKDILERILKGEEINRWKVEWNGKWVIFPYEISDDNSTLIEFDELQSEYPRTAEYLSSCESSLKNRSGVGENDWHGFAYPKNHPKFTDDKVMVRVNSHEPCFVPDLDGRYYFVGSGGGSGGYGLRFREEHVSSNDDFLYYVCLLNSAVTEFVNEHVSAILGGKYYMYNQRFLKPLPLKSSERQQKEKVSEYGEDMLDLVETLTDLEYKVSDVRNYLMEFERASAILDLANSIDLDDDDYRQDPIRINDKMEVSSENVYQVVMKKGHTLDFEEESIRDFVYELLKSQDRRLGRMEILNMDVPTRDNVLVLMDEYESDETRIAELEAEVEELQTKIDNLILRDVYDLNDEDVKVVEEFLEVW
jgi:type I restriction-modification system DNA methylase subunit